MIIKQRTKSISYLVLESLNCRKSLSSAEKAQYENQLKGFNGELEFDRCMTVNELPGLIINDLLLRTRETYYQIDSLLICGDHIFLYEVKNYTGSYYYRDGDIYSESGHTLQNPLAQAERKRAYLHNLLLNNGYRFEITSFVVFINPNFYIYNLPRIDSFLFAGQLISHFDSLTKRMFTNQNKQLDLVNKLVSLHDNTFRPFNLPDYSFGEVKKGIICPKCFSFEYSTSRQIRYCSTCGFNEKSSMAILRTIEEFQLLFPAEPLTTRIIYEWCANDWSKHRIKRVLKQHFNSHYAGRGSYYS